MNCCDRIPLYGSFLILVSLLIFGALFIATDEVTRSSATVEVLRQAEPKVMLADGTQSASAVIMHFLLCPAP